MPQQIFHFHQILRTQEFLAANPLNLPIEFVHKHGRLRRAVPLAPRHHSGGCVVLPVSCSAPSLSSPITPRHILPSHSRRIRPSSLPHATSPNFSQIERDSNRRRLLNSSPPPPIQTTPGYSPPPTTLPTHWHTGCRLSSLSISTLLQPLRSSSSSPLTAAATAVISATTALPQTPSRFQTSIAAVSPKICCCSPTKSESPSPAVSISSLRSCRLHSPSLLLPARSRQPATVVQPCQSVPERFLNEPDQPRNNPD